MKKSWLPKQFRSEEFTYTSEKSIEELSRKLQDIVNNSTFFRFEDQFNGEMISEVKFKLFVEMLKLNIWYQQRPFVLVYLYEVNNQTYVSCTYHTNKNIIYSSLFFLVFSTWIMIQSLFSAYTDVGDIALKLAFFTFAGFLLLGLGELGKIRLKKTFIKSLPVKVLRKENT